jgi:site-specific recombinase XerD
MHMDVLRKLAARIGWDRELQRITSRDIEAFRASRLEGGLAGASANKELRQLRRMFNLAIQRGYLPRDGNQPRGSRC